MPYSQIRSSVAKMQMQGIMLALVSVYGMQMICKYLNLDPTVAMGLQVPLSLSEFRLFSN